MVRDGMFENEDAVAAKSLAAGLPARVFDVHAHFYRKDTLSVAPDNLFATGPDFVVCCDQSFGRDNLL